MEQTVYVLIWADYIETEYDDRQIEEDGTIIGVYTTVQAAQAAALEHANRERDHWPRDATVLEWEPEYNGRPGYRADGYIRNYHIWPYPLVGALT